MALPDFNAHGDLPVGVHVAPLAEVLARFGPGTPQRQAVTANLLRIHRLAAATGKLGRFVLFGSYSTAKLEPNDVDVILVMQDDFQLSACDEEMRGLFDHQRSAAEFGASIFWVRPSMLFLESLDNFIQHWQIKRDQTRRGIVEVTP